MALAKGNQIFFHDQKGIRISMIMSIFLTCMSTPKLEYHMCKLSNLPIMLISTRLWISPMEVLKSWKLHVEMECAHVERCPPSSHIQYSTLQKTTSHYCTTRIIIKSTSIGVPTLIYSGLSS